MLKAAIMVLVGFVMGVVANEYWQRSGQANNVTDNKEALASINLQHQEHHARDVVGHSVSENDAVGNNYGGTGGPENIKRETFSEELVRQLMANQQFAQAIALLRQEWARASSPAIEWLLVQAYQASGQHREAIEHGLHYLQYESDRQKLEVARAALSHYLLTLSSQEAPGVDALWLAQQLDALIQLTSDDPELHLAAAHHYLTAEDAHQAQYHALIAVNAPSTQKRAEALLAQLNGATLVKDTSLSLVRLGNQFLVNVSIDGNPARFLLDTGASLSGLSSHYLLKYPNLVGATKPIRLNTANGAVDSYLFTVNQLTLGELRFDQHILARLPLDAGVEFDGLLGVDVLGRFDFVIDQNQARLHLTSRK